MTISGFALINHQAKFMNLTTKVPALDDILDGTQGIPDTRTHGIGPEGKLPITEDMLLNEPSGNLFGMTQNAGMGWNPDEVGLTQYLILSTHGGMRNEDGTPMALG